MGMERKVTKILREIHAARERPGVQDGVCGKVWGPKEREARARGWADNAFPRYLEPGLDH